MARYQLRITTRSEVHIGDGQALRREFEFTVHEGRFYRLSVPHLLARYEEEEIPDDLLDRLTDVPPARWLDPEDFRRADRFPYILPGDPQVGEVRSFVKDPLFRPYLPGSSLKGALRTVILWEIWRERGERLTLSQLDRRREWAGQPIERAWLGRDPNHDLLRALRPGDSQPVPASTSLVIARAVVQVGPRQAAPISVEALRPGITLTATLSIDERLLEIGERKLGWEGKGKFLRSLAAVARNFALDRIRKEQAWAQAHQLGALQSFYADLRARLDRMRAEKRPAFLLRVGWGGGWESKTLGKEPFDEAAFEELLRRYIRPKGDRRPGDPFPRSRRVVVDGQGRPLRPFGWVEVEMEPA
ncbi:type III-A CRISPR-associated RAMP protein Csm5 [Thermoflexus sp.]|uniref:type III-A CRISPR-associated RAMP protein Csm5 n=1 Tax=Thermoflexus sp. TaxID=1969742 RepID=UPI0025F3DCEB|nr:type III-A CRISPR-associated RAMP protein Csm5 [Thermoflexus sp.]MDW8181447.1 type III-A CRISPR-associated RAMP protein Csm5 [Anaerolineae bacterium]MCS6962926.1 type III-A CRISPR-associated RAMP protein Csm5 [Thermoflexus sp.]MCS7351988.1 type III-A CRISPR-associated RAMP protein Csm5 [Thermoflexus sp.]MCX7691209.1 type III-A CRISPR-associated RAMP protein Csm5 [Thermoflexus sp.]MDW8185863.1 type III-A CRISPR-associated RAMP protein Csm5 [Anaerolineae bacterium]